MGGMSRRKGCVGERELVQELNSRGLLCHRTAQRRGDLGGAADVECEAMPLHIECKRTERIHLWEWVDQCQRDAKGEPFVIMHRSNNRPWVAIMLLPHWLNDSTAASCARDHRSRLLGLDGNEAL